MGTTTVQSIDQPIDSKGPITNVTMAAIGAVQEIAGELKELERQALEARLEAVEASQAKLMSEIQAQGQEISNLRSKLTEIKQRRTGDIAARQTGASLPAH